MCPACFTTAALTVAGAASGAGAAALVVRKWRTLRRWLGRSGWRASELPRHDRAGRQEEGEDSPQGYPQTPRYKWWNWHDNYAAEASPDPKWVKVSDAGEATFRERG